MMQQREGMLAGSGEHVLVRGHLPENVQVPHGVARMEKLHARVLVLLRGGDPAEDLADLGAKALGAALRVHGITAGRCSPSA